MGWNTWVSPTVWIPLALKRTVSLRSTTHPIHTPTHSPGGGGGEGGGRRTKTWKESNDRVQELCESRGGRPELSVLMTLTVSGDVKQH